MDNLKDIELERRQAKISQVQNDVEKVKAERQLADNMLKS